MAKASSKTHLRRDLSLFSLIAIAAGGTLGGWLAEAPFWFQLTGTGAGILFPILALLLIPVGLAFSELTAMLPFSSSVNAWSTAAMGPGAGWATHWAFFLVQVVEPPLVAYIFVAAASYYLDISVAIKPLIAIFILLVWYVVSNFKIELTGRLAVIFFLVMVGITLLNALYYFFSGHWHLTNITQHGGFFPFGIMGGIAGASALVLKYIGFGMTPTLIQETNFPARKMAIVILLALFIPAIVYLIATLSIGGLAPHDVIASLSIPEPELVNKLDMLGIIGILALLSGLLYAFTTLMGFWVSSARVLYGAAQMKQLPPWFQKLNSRGQPYIGNIVILGFGVFFAIFTNTNWVQYVYSLSVVAAGITYFLVCLSAYILRDKHPEWDRPYRAFGGKGMFMLGMIVSAAITIIGMTLLPANAWPPIIIYIIIGAAIPVGMKYYRQKHPRDYEPVVLTPRHIETLESDND